MNNHWTIISEQGEREYMEDRHCLLFDYVKSKTVFGGVYDGHSGAEAAELVAQELQQIFKDMLKGKKTEEAFRIAYQSVHEKVTGKSGTCAANFYIAEGKIYFANVGDCRIIIVGDKGVRQLTRDDNVSDETESKRVIVAGAKIRGPYLFHGYNGLQVTRAIGDHAFQNVGVIPEPHTGITAILPGDSYLIAASDGLFKSLKNDEIAEIALVEKNPSSLGERLKKEVLEQREGTDNLTIIIGDLKNGI